MISILVFLGGFIYVVLNILQSALLVSGQKNLMSILHFVVAIIWGTIIVAIIANPMINIVAYSAGSSLGMLFSGYLNNNILIGSK